MKLIECVVLIVILPIFALTFARGGSLLIKNHSSYVRDSRDFERNKSIANSFRALCRDESYNVEKFDSLARDLSALWALDSFSVDTEGIKDKKRLLKCSWVKDDSWNCVWAECSSDK